MKFSPFLVLVLSMLLVFVQVSPTQAQQLKVVDMETITDNLGGIADKVKSGDIKVKESPATLAIGGAIGLLVGGLASNFIDFEFMGISMVPVAGALAGVYLANEGYLDRVQDMLK